MPLSRLNLSKQFSEAQARGDIKNNQDLANFITTCLKQIIKDCSDNNLRKIIAYNEDGIATVDVVSSLPNGSQEKIGQLTLILIEKNGQEPAGCSTAVLSALVKGKLSFDKLTQEDIAFAVAEQQFLNVQSTNGELLNASVCLANKICSIYKQVLTSAINTPTEMPLLLRWLPNYITHQKETSKYTEIFNAMSALLHNPKSQRDYQTLVNANNTWSKNKPYFDNNWMMVFGWAGGIGAIILFLSCFALLFTIITGSAFIIPLIVVVVSGFVGSVGGLSLLFMNWANFLQQITPLSELKDVLQEASQFQELLPANPNNRNAAVPLNVNNHVAQGAHAYQTPLFAAGDDAEEVPTPEQEPGQEEEVLPKSNNG